MRSVSKKFGKRCKTGINFMPGKMIRILCPGCCLDAHADFYLRSSSWQYQKQFRHWKIRKNRTEHEWKQYFATPGIGPGRASDDVPHFMGRDLQRSSKRAKRCVSMPLAPDVPDFTCSARPTHEPHQISTRSPIERVLSPDISQSGVEFLSSNLANAVQDSGSALIHNATLNGSIFATGDVQGGSQQILLGATSDLAPSFDFDTTISTNGRDQIQWLRFEPDSFDSNFHSPKDLSEGSNADFLFPLQDAIFILDLPFTNTEHVLRSNRITTGNSLWGTTVTGFAYRSISAILPSRDRPEALRTAALQASLRRLGSLIPGESFDLIAESEAFETNFVRMLVFSVLNGFAGLNNMPLEQIIRFLNRFTNRLFLDILEQCPSHVLRTVADNIFRAAIEAQDVKVVKLLLERRLVDSNETVCFDKRRKCTAIERAAYLGSLDLIRSLIDWNADANRTYTPGRNFGYAEFGGGALAMLLDRISMNSERGRFTIQPELVEAFNQLVSAGARVESGFFDLALRDRAAELLRLISPNMRPESHREYFMLTEYGHACDKAARMAQIMDDRSATRWFRNILGHCNRLCNNECLKDGFEALKKAATAAARTGKLELVKFLVQEGHVNPRTPQMLTAAISSQTWDLIEFVLSFGPDLDPPAVDDYWGSQGSRYGCCYSTPIAEAVRHGNNGLTRMLESGGSLDRLNEGGRFKPLLNAAVETGEKNYVTKLLRHKIASARAWNSDDVGKILHRPRQTPPADGPEALTLAAEGGHRDILRMLLKAGAVKGNMYQIDYRSVHYQALRASIRHHDTQMIRDLIEFQYQARYELGGLELLRETLDAECTLMSIVVEEYPGMHFSREQIQSLLGQCIKTDNVLFFKTFLQTLSTGDILLDYCLETAIEFSHAELIDYFIDLGANPFTHRVHSW